MEGSGGRKESLIQIESVGGSEASRKSSVVNFQNYFTSELQPREANYEHGKHPTIFDLLNPTVKPVPAEPEEEEQAKTPKKKGKVIKFGWKEGVLMRCLLNIWGVMLFLRVSWVVGQAGIVQGVLLVTVANFVTAVTAMSMSAVATNGKIDAGGIYYMISRSLGPELGGSIGLMFTIANSLAASTYIIGFVNSLQDMMRDYFGMDYIIVDGRLVNGVYSANDIRILGTITLIFVLLLAIVGMDWVTRVQMALLILLIFAQIDYIIGEIVGPLDDEERAKGFIGFNREILEANTEPSYREQTNGKSENFFSVLGVYFPAVTGIVAGANLSGDLKDPSVAIPKGTLTAIAVTFVTYVIYPIMLGASVVRDAYGDKELYQHYANESTGIYDNPTFNRSYCQSNYTEDGYCHYGLVNNFQVMELVSIWGPLIYVGCFSATLSSAIASLVGAPRVLQALAKDKLYPYIHFFSVGHGANNDPFRGYFLVFILSFLVIMIADLNVVSTLVTNFFLASYSLINFSCFHASLIKSPGWRPTYKFYNLWLSLLGGVMCLIMMFFIDYRAAIITYVSTLALFLYVIYSKSGDNVNTGSSVQAQRYLSALNSTVKLISVQDHIKNYRPQVLLLSGSPPSRPPLLHLGKHFTKNISLLASGHVVTDRLSVSQREATSEKVYRWMTKRDIDSFYTIIEAETLDVGARSLYQLVGLGKLRPNMVLLGYKSDWNKCPPAELKAYFNTLHETFSMQLGIAILRLPNGCDFSSVLEDEEALHEIGTKSSESPQQQNKEKQNNTIKEKIETSSSSESPPSPSSTSTNAKTNAEKKKQQLAAEYKGRHGENLPQDKLDDVTFFIQKKQKGMIDIWWLFDDGGLTLLLPYILTTRSHFKDCTLRVFALANNPSELVHEQQQLAKLLSKFRIKCKVIIIANSGDPIQKSTQQKFDSVIKDFMIGNKADNNLDGVGITESELLQLKVKTKLNLRLHELLHEHSKDSTLIVMTLPIPRQTTVSASLYMAWLEMLTKNLPPFLFVRGNQTSVITFYS